MKKEEWTLTEVARLLQQPQHRLIYLCEKIVVVPDCSGAEGRGSSRRFSARNIFEISVALILNEFHFPVMLSGFFLYAIRSFESDVGESIESFRLPDALRRLDAPEIVGILTNGSRLHFGIRSFGQPMKYFGGVEIDSDNLMDNLSFMDDDLQKNTSAHNQIEVNSSISSHTSFEINLTQIAQNFNLE